MRKLLLLVFVVVIIVASIITIRAHRQTPEPIDEQTFGSGEILSGDKPITNSPDGETPDDSALPAQTPEKQALEDESSKIMAMNWDAGLDISFYIKDLETGETVTHNIKKMNSASLIKLFIMVDAFERDLDGTLPFTPEIKVKLKEMITKSDNDASRFLTDVYYPENVETLNMTAGDITNAGILKTPVSFADKGFPDSVMERKMHDKLPPSGSTGKDNWTTVEDIGKLLEQIYNKQCVSKAASEEMLSLLQQQEKDNKIPKLIKEQKLPVIVANKTGELSRVENDAAIIAGPWINDFIFVIMISNIPYEEDNEPKNIETRLKVTNNIAEIALDLVGLFEK